MEWRKLLLAGLLFFSLFALLPGCKDGEATAPLPEANFSFELLDPGKPPARVVFTSQSQYATSHFWRFTPSASSNEVSPSYDFRASGTYRVLLTVSNESGQDTVSRLVKIPPLEYYAQNSVVLPNPLVLPIDVRFVDESFGAAINYFWDFGNGVTSINRNPTATYMAYGDYQVRQIVTFSGGGVDSLRFTLRLRQ